MAKKIFGVLIWISFWFLSTQLLLAAANETNDCQATHAKCLYLNKNYHLATDEEKAGYYEFLNDLNKHTLPHNQLTENKIQCLEDIAQACNKQQTFETFTLTPACQSCVNSSYQPDTTAVSLQSLEDIKALFSYIKASSCNAKQLQNSLLTKEMLPTIPDEVDHAMKRQVCITREIADGKCPASYQDRNPVTGLPRTYTLLGGPFRDNAEFYDYDEKGAVRVRSTPCVDKITYYSTTNPQIDPASLDYDYNLLCQEDTLKQSWCAYSTAENIGGIACINTVLDEQGQCEKTYNTYVYEGGPYPDEQTCLDRAECYSAGKLYADCSNKYQGNAELITACQDKVKADYPDCNWGTSCPSPAQTSQSFTLKATAATPPETPETPDLISPCPFSQPKPEEIPADSGETTTPTTPTTPGSGETPTPPAANPPETTSGTTPGSAVTAGGGGATADGNPCAKLTGEAQSTCLNCLGDPNNPEGFWTAIGCIPVKPLPAIAKIFPLAMGLAGFFVLIQILMGAFGLITSAGNPSAVQKARERIVNSIIALLFIAFSTIILQLIGNQIFMLPGFGAASS